MKSTKFSLIVFLLFMCFMFFGSKTSFADISFSDTTFNLANYTETPLYTSNPLITSSYYSQNNTFTILESDPVNGTIAQGFVNNTFSYNPQTQGAIGSISFSEFKDVTYSNTVTINTNSYALIQQDGIFYVAKIPGTIIVNGTTTGLQKVSQSGMLATDFVQYNFQTESYGTANPNFNNDPMLFGFATISNYQGNPTPITKEIDIQNLSFGVTPAATPIPAAAYLLGSGLMGLFGFRRREKI